MSSKPATAGWYRLEIGTTIQQDDTWDYVRNNNDGRYDRRDVPINRIGTKVTQDDEVAWYRFAVSD